MTAVALGMPVAASRTAPLRPDGSRRPAHDGLVDRYGRVATDLRVSLTDRCNLRCTYCMPAEGLDWLPGDQVLSGAEIGRLIRIAVDRLGVRQIRFTGGEPLLRNDIVELVGAAGRLAPRPELALTTNGLGLHRKAAALAAAGLDRINVSLDTLDRDTFARLTRRDRLPDVLAGLAAARDAGLRPIKINAVLLRGVNDHEASELLEFSLRNGFALRFIEQMPLDAGHVWERGEMVTAAEIFDRLARRFELRPRTPDRPGAPAELFDVIGGPRGSGPATVGIIASITRPFCGDCDRTRLTADGQIRACLFSRTETDLRALLRGGADDETIAATWRVAMWGKQAGHGVDDPSFVAPDRPMSAIGG